MTKTTLAHKPAVWAEFVVMTGDDHAPHIHARLSTEKGFDLISALLDEAGSVDIAKESFKREMDRLVRRA